MGAALIDGGTGEGLSDQELVALTCQGEELAFAELVRRHERMVRGMVYGMVGASDVNDVTQEVFLAAYQSLKGFRGESSFKTWLTKIIIHRTASFHRRRALRMTDSLSRPSEEGDRETYLEIPDWTDNPETVLQESERQRRVARAMERLPFPYRQALTLRISEGLSYEEIARLTDCPPGTVKSRLHNAKILVAKYLREDFP